MLKTIVMEKHGLSVTNSFILLPLFSSGRRRSPCILKVPSFLYKKVPPLYGVISVKLSWFADLLVDITTGSGSPDFSNPRKVKPNG